VAPPGTAMPARRNTWPLPRCRSAITRRPRAGQYRARSPISATGSPASRMASAWSGDVGIALLQLRGGASHARLPGLGAELAAQAFGPERKRQRRERARLAQRQDAALAVAQGRQQPRRLQLQLEDLAFGLRQQQMTGIVAAQHVIEQAAGGL